MGIPVSPTATGAQDALLLRIRLLEGPLRGYKAYRGLVTVRGKYEDKVRIQDADLYNFDETGFMMGVICHGMVGTRSDGNPEWATVITCTNGEGWSIPPFLVVEGQYHLASWYTATGLPQTRP